MTTDKIELECSKLTPRQLFAELEQLETCDDLQLQKALQTRLLNDLDTYLLIGSGRAKFIADAHLAL